MSWQTEACRLQFFSLVASGLPTIDLFRSIGGPGGSLGGCGADVWLLAG